MLTRCGYGFSKEQFAIPFEKMKIGSNRAQIGPVMGLPQNAEER